MMELVQDNGAYLTLAVVALMFVLFLRETYPTEVVALTGVSVRATTSVG